MRIAKKKVRRVAKYNEKNTISSKKRLEEEAKYIVKIGHVRNDSAVLTSTSFTIEDRQYKL